MTFSDPAILAKMPATSPAASSTCGWTRPSTRRGRAGVRKVCSGMPDGFPPDSVTLDAHFMNLMGGPELSIVIPVFNEEAVLPALIERLRSFAAQLTPLVTEIILVDDHSADRSPELLKRASRHDSRFRYARLAKNSGSHVAILAGLAHARGEC